MTTSDESPCPGASTPQAEHAWLEQLLGDWTVESECSMGPGQETWKASGVETVRSIGGLWIVAEGAGDMPGGGSATTLMTVGFNPETGRFVGTFVASMMAHLWIYDGELDASRRVLTLGNEGPLVMPDAAPGQMARYRDVIEVVSGGVRTLKSFLQLPDGSWSQFMTATYTRKAGA